MRSAMPSFRNSSMVRALWMLPLGCQRVSDSVLNTVERTPYMSRCSASASPIGPPPTMATPVVSFPPGIPGIPHGQKAPLHLDDNVFFFHRHPKGLGDVGALHQLLAGLDGDLE